LLFGFSFISGIRKSALFPAARGLCVALVAYAVQAVVNIAQPMTTPIAILIVGALVSWGASEVGDKKSDLNEVDEISKESDKQVRLIRFSIGNW
jgi:hypothetical protein